MQNHVVQVSVVDLYNMHIYEKLWNTGSYDEAGFNLHYLSFLHDNPRTCQCFFCFFESIRLWAMRRNLPM